VTVTGVVLLSPRDTRLLRFGVVRRFDSSGVRARSGVWRALQTTTIEFFRMETLKREITLTFGGARSHQGVVLSSAHAQRPHLTQNKIL